MIFIPILAFCRLLRQYGRPELGGLLFRPIDEPGSLQIPASQIRSNIEKRTLGSRESEMHKASVALSS